MHARHGKGSGRGGSTPRHSVYVTTPSVSVWHSCRRLMPSMFLVAPLEATQCIGAGLGHCLAWHIESYPAEFVKLGQESRKNSEIHIDVSHSRQPLVKGERLVRYEVNTVMTRGVAQVQGRSTTPAMCTHSKYACTGLHTKQHLKMHMCRLILAMVRYAWLSLLPTVLGSYVIGSPRGCAAPGEVPCQGNT